ncbi:MAG TPA: glutathione S-transferase N-terminal domain-containing protein, partial [Casimicrobiaceae bacterium]|nr:glutathione S-transferase N-terminal domain-containing protein [Casimicrobiaceae bacterium]
MKLIASLTSPYARKVRIVLAEKKIECDLVEDSPWAPDTSVPDYNPLGKVPVLVLDDGTNLFDSRVIVQYL